MSLIVPAPHHMCAIDSKHDLIWWSCCIVLQLRFMYNSAICWKKFGINKCTRYMKVDIGEEIDSGISAMEVIFFFNLLSVNIWYQHYTNLSDWLCKSLRFNPMSKEWTAHVIMCNLYRYIEQYSTGISPLAHINYINNIYPFIRKVCLNLYILQFSPLG